MTFCYVLSSGLRTPYASMMFISVSSVRKHHPTAAIYCLLARDADSPQLREVFRDLNVDFIPCAVNDGDQRLQSRFLKTTMRSRLSGDFIYLDVDTLITNSVGQIWEGVEGIAAAYDRNRVIPTPHFPRWMEETYRRLEWKYPVPYFNSGVIAIRDTDSVHHLFYEWHKRWRQTCEIGVVLDQPSFNSAIDKCGASTSELHWSFNAMVDACPRFTKQGKILHFYTTRGRPNEDMVLAQMLREYETGATISWKQLDECCRLNHPWGLPYKPWRLMQSGHKIRAIKCKISQILRGVF